jgi:hypothetical protein
MDQRSSVYHIQPIGARHTAVNLLAFGSFIHVPIAGMLEQSRNRVRRGLSYRPARLHRPGRIDPMESIRGLQSLKNIRTEQSLRDIIQAHDLQNVASRNINVTKCNCY